MSNQKSLNRNAERSPTSAAEGISRKTPDLRWRPRADLTVAAVLVVMAGAGWLATTGWLTAWGWLLITAALGVGLWVVKRQESIGRPHPTGPTGPPAGGSRDRRGRSAAAPVVHEFDFDGLQLVTGNSERTDRRILVTSTRLNRETIGFAVLNTATGVGDADIREMMHLAFARSATPHRAAARLLHRLAGLGDLPSALVGMWYPLPRLLAYVSVGLEEAVIFRGTPGRPMDRPAWLHRPSPVQAFRGLHRLDRDERWVFYTPDLVEVPDPMNRPYSRVAIAQYGSSERGMRPRPWVEYLLNKAAAAQVDGLPEKSMMLALVCNQAVPRPEEKCIPATVPLPFGRAAEVSPNRLLRQPLDDPLSTDTHAKQGPQP